MTVEVSVEETKNTEVVVSEKQAKMVNENEVDEKVVENTQNVEDEPKPSVVEKSSSYREESNYLSDLKDGEKKALSELKLKVEEAISSNTLIVSEVKKDKEHISNEKKDKTEETDEKVDEKSIKEEESETKTEEIEDISIWGVPLLSGEGSDVILLKFLRAREFKVNEAFEMLKKTLVWRKDFKIESILDEDLGEDLANAAYMKGNDRENHPVCYNIFGVFGNEELYQKTFGTEAKREQFLRWRFQFMEKGIQKLDFRPGGVTSILQVYDLKNCPGPSKKEIRNATYKAVGLLQDNYPELVAKNVFINVPFWYYAFYSLISPFLTQRSKSKFVVARPPKVTETLLRYIPLDEIPTQYGGFKRENDSEFSAEDGGVSEIILKPGSTETIEIPAPDGGSTVTWDLAVLGWEVSYKEEFIPTDEGSYTVIIQKQKKMDSIEGPVRNSFKNNEPGKVVLTIQNQSKKKKRVFCRHQNQKNCSA
ncbi:patellin-4 [Beta vulgaris subsp. vulgaris]|uniref:patellin-4 n=1 Tax=Beta vulgaris subsp. vulgaris TaxID=3555 RepID=UPI0020366D65|nr:patellin-4 [Beta vulgaris subsp. vulgaris]